MTMKGLLMSDVISYVPTRNVRETLFAPAFRIGKLVEAPP